MKRTIRKLIVITMSLLLVIPLLSGCGPKKPTPEDAQAYVKAVLDIICTGDYDHSVNLGDIEEGAESELQASIIDESLENFGTESGISDEMKASFREVMLRAFSLAKYTVGDAAATDDGGYDVTVSIEPLQLFRGFNDSFESVVSERAEQDIEKIRNMSEAEQTDYIMGIIIDMLNANLDDPQYDAAEEITVHYGLLDEEQNAYGCTSEEGQKLGERIFSLEGVE